MTLPDGWLIIAQRAKRHENTRFMQYPCYVKKIIALLAFVCTIQFGFASIPCQPIQRPEAKLLMHASQKPNKSGLQDGHQESSITLKYLKYLSLAKAIYEEKAQQQKLSMPGIVVDDVIVMLHDTPHSLYSKTTPLHLERSPG